MRRHRKNPQGANPVLQTILCSQPGPERPPLSMHHPSGPSTQRGREQRRGDCRAGKPGLSLPGPCPQLPFQPVCVLQMSLWGPCLPPSPRWTDAALPDVQSQELSPQTQPHTWRTVLVLSSSSSPSCWSRGRWALQTEPRTEGPHGLRHA